MIISDVALTTEYDAFFREDPDRWISPDRNRFMLNVMSKYTEPKHVLDIGCGNGHTLAEVGKRYPQTKLYGIDISAEALSLAACRVPDLHTYLDFVDQTSPANSFDWVLCMGTAEHFQRLNASLLKIREFTGGYLYFEVPNCLSYSPGPAGYRRLTHGSRQVEWHLSRPEWEKHLINAGLEIVESLTGESPEWEFVWVMK